MKQKLLSLVLLLCALIVGSGSAWADTTGTINFGSASGSLNVNGASVSGLDNQSKTWTVTTAGTTSFTPNASYAQIGSSSKPATSITFTATIAAETVNVKSVSAKFGGFSSTAGTVTLKVGDTSVGSGSLSGTSDVTVSSTKAQTGTTVTVTVTGISKGVKAYYITYTYEAVSSGETTTTTIDASGITNTNRFVSTDAGSLSASVTYGSPATAVPESSVTWSGDNDEVATINSSTGAVTLVGAGIVTFTASFAGDEDYASSSSTYEMTVTNEDPSLVEIWSENFSGYNANDVPADGTFSYASSSGTKVMDEKLAGGDEPELLVAKNGGTFSATVTLLTSTYGYSGDLSLKYKTNAKSLNVKSTTDGITVDGEENEGDGISFDTSGTHTVTFKGVTTSTESITIVFTTTSNNNVRLDDIVLKGAQAALTKVATPAISPASGAVASETEVTITCATDGATIYYTMGADPADPTSSSTLYNPESKPTISTATTIKAIAIKEGLTNSDVASASYTIAEPCETPTFSVSEGEVEKGTTVIISTETADATIYYTTDGTTPTTSSTAYSSAITINAAMTIKAIAVKEGMANSAVATASYTVKDYATLPFSWDDTSTPTGVTNNGVGSYATSPYLKFDGTGDYVILKIAETPGKLTFDMKGNSLSGTYKFRVLESTNGSDYSTLKEYTSIGSSTTSETLNPASTTRYIKWEYTTKASGNVALGNINLTGCVSITISSAEYATYSGANALDFTGQAKAYTATDEGTYVKLHEITSGQVPANTPVVLYKEGGGTINVPMIASADAVGANDLHVSAGTTYSNAYVLAKPAGNPVGFYLWNSSTTLNAGKIYMQGSGSSARSFLGFNFDEETTSIENITPSFSHSEGAQAVYDLQGRKVSKPSRGLYIVNGKKVVIK